MVAQRPFISQFWIESVYTLYGDWPWLALLHTINVLTLIVMCTSVGNGLCQLSVDFQKFPALCYKGTSIYYRCLKAQFHPFVSLNVVLKISKICYFVSCSSCVHFRSLWDWKPFCLSLITVFQTMVFYFVHMPFLTICQFSLVLMDLLFYPYFNRTFIFNF